MRIPPQDCPQSAFCLLLLLAAALALLILPSQPAAAADDPQYEVGIGALRFDPKAREQIVAGPGRQIGAELARRRSGPAHYLLQLHRSPDAQARAELKAKYGIKLEDYVPNLSFVERLDGKTVAAIAADPRVRAVVPYDPAFKIAPGIGKLVPRTAARKAVKGLALRALLFADANPAAAAQSITSLGARQVKVLDDRRLKGGAAQVRFVLPNAEPLTAIARLDSVRWIEEVGEMIEDDAAAAATLQSGDAANPVVWNKNLHGEGQIIGIIDGGIPDLNHCFFRDPANNAPGPAHRKILQLRNAGGALAKDHPTFTAGNAAGDDLDKPGSHPYRGSAWASKLVVGTRADASTNTLLAELTAAARAGATVHSNSWHRNSGNPTTYEKAARDVDAFTWENEDHLVLGSVGNLGEEQGAPGTSKNAIGVAAAFLGSLQMSYRDGNPGPTADGRRKPDLTAPGCRVGSAKVNTACAVRFGCATSFSTPHAAGAAALVRQYFTEGWYPSGTRQQADAFKPSGALLKAALINSTVNLTGVPRYPNEWEGWGLIRLDNALYFAGAARRAQLWDVRKATGLVTGEERSHTVTVVDGAQPLKVVLVWTDPPPAAGASSPVVNDLDLVVVSPDGAQTFAGNVFGDAGHSVTGGVADKINNVEVAHLEAPAAGQWTIKVLGTTVNVGAPGQGYALVVSGALAPPPPAVTGALPGR